MSDQFPRSSWSNRPKFIREEVTTIFFLGITITLLIEALNVALTTWMVFGAFMGYILVLLFTRFQEQTPSPWWHFNKSLEGCMLGAIPLICLFYFFTIISENRTNLAQFRAQIAVVYCGFMLVYVLLSGIPFLGIVFTILMAWWSGTFLNYLKLYDYPIIISPGIMLCILMGLGLWFTDTTFVWVNFRKSESFGSSTLSYQKVAKITCFGKIIIGIVILILHSALQTLLLSGLSVIVYQILL